MARRTAFGIVMGLALGIAGTEPVPADQPPPAPPRQWPLQHWTPPRPAVMQPAIDDLIAEAAADHKPLVLEFGAAWCEPCVVLEQVEADPAVVQALGTVVYGRYDIESRAGAAVAARYHVKSVPTLLVLDGNGHVQRRRCGLQSGEHAALVRWFVEFLATTEQRAAASPAAAGPSARPPLRSHRCPAIGGRLRSRAETGSRLRTPLGREALPAR